MIHIFLQLSIFSILYAVLFLSILVLYNQKKERRKRIFYRIEFISLRAYT